MATGRPIPYSQMDKFNYFRICQKIINDEPPQLPAGMFSPEMSDFLKLWYVYQYAASQRSRKNEPQRRRCSTTPGFSRRQGRRTLGNLWNECRLSPDLYAQFSRLWPTLHSLVNLLCCSFRKRIIALRGQIRCSNATFPAQVALSSAWKTSRGTHRSNRGMGRSFTRGLRSLSSRPQERNLQ